MKLRQPVGPDRQHPRSASVAFDSKSYAELRRSRVLLCRDHRSRYLSHRGMMIEVGASHPDGGSVRSSRLLAALVAVLLLAVTMSAVLDGLHLISGDRSWLVLSHWGLGLAVALGAITAIVGTILLWQTRSGSMARKTVATVVLSSVVVVIPAAASWLLRSGDPAATGVLAFVLCFIAAGMAIVTGGMTGDLIGARPTSVTATQQ